MPGGDTVVGVLGAGAMGSGIAQVAAGKGHRVVLGDASAAAVRRAREGIAASLRRDVEKQRSSRADADALLGRIEFVEDPAAAGMAAYRDCGLVIEAIIEELAPKQAGVRALAAVVPAGCVLATNTSSLSIASIAAGCPGPERVLGIHFFNPATLMPLVEIVPWLGTDPAVAEGSRRLVEGWGKTTVLAADTPGFVVNRIARPFYAEALRMLEEGVADIATIDWAMRAVGGFRMGPFELMDLIGHDVNYAVTRSVFEAFYFDPRFRPSITQKRLVEAGYLGRKSGRGFYSYAEGAATPAPREDRALGQGIVDRTVAMLVNEAADAVFLRVATPADIDLAMTKGVNYPKGPCAWGDEIGIPEVLARMEALHAEYGEDRYRPNPLLRRMAREGRRFHERA